MSTGGLPPPPAPVLDDGAGFLVQSAQGEPDVGGLIGYEISADEGSHWEPGDLVAWSTPYNWGPLGPFAGLWIRAYEVGNGVTYSGTSAYSNTIVRP